jgi:hypothetical protein
MRWPATPSMRSPANDTVPERGFSIPAIDLSKVDLPAPFAPATTTISPSATPIEMSEMAMRPR